MRPRPFYRWKSFWLGVLVLAFLGWSWVRSMEHFSGWFARTPAADWDLTVGAGRVILNRIPNFEGMTTRWLRLGVIQGGVGDRREWFPRADVRRDPSPEYPYPNAKVILPHWLLILLFLVPWLGFLVWRGRKLKKPEP